MNANYDNALTTVIGIIKQLTKGSLEVTADTAIQGDTGMTSLQVMEMVLEIEETFDISFPLNRLPDIRTVQDLTREVIAVLER